MPRIFNIARNLGGGHIRKGSKWYPWGVPEILGENTEQVPEWENTIQCKAKLRLTPVITFLGDDLE